MNKALVCALSMVCLACGGDAKRPPPTASPTPTAPTATPDPAPAAKSLFDRLGGKPAIDAVADEFVNRTTTDPRIKLRFFNTDAANLKKLLAEFVCKATGGPCTYTGRDMTESHAGMELVDDEFTALVENLVAALDKFKVGSQEKGELLAALGPLKPQMVVAADTLKPIPEAQLAKVEKLGPQKSNVASELLTAAVVAGRRGQRSYAEQLFTRAELEVGDKRFASVASVFRDGAPPRITSAVKVSKDTAPQPAKLGNSEDDEPDKKPQTGQLKGTMQVAGKPITGMGVVMLWPKQGAAKKRVPKQRVIEQRGKTFAPHVMAVPVGSTVSFPNFDTIFHNVFSLSRSKPFDLGMYKNGELREVKFEKAGIIRLGCNIHANMSAYLIVVDAPHYVVAEPDGSFSFRSLKPGTYKAQAWTEQSAEPTSSEVVIKVGANEVTLDVKGGATPGPGANKFGTSRAASR